MRESNAYADLGRLSLLHVALVGLSIAMLSVACGGENKADTQGAVGQPCYPDDTCDEGLFCISGVCTTGIASTPDPDAGIPQFSDARSNITTPDGSVASFPDASDEPVVPSDAGDSPSDDAEAQIADSEVPCTGPDCGPCVPGCTAGDEPRCIGVREQVCGDHDTDSCLEWSAGTPNARCVFFEDPKEADWGACSEVCGPGEQIATRKCVDLTRNPAPDQTLCNGDPDVTRPCNVRACALAITQQPVSVTAALGVKKTFTAAAQGPPAPAYQWYIRPAGSDVKWAKVEGATKPTLGVEGTIPHYKSEFLVQVTNKTGWKNSAIVKVLPVLKPYGVVIDDCGDGWNGQEWRCAQTGNAETDQLTTDQLCRIKTEKTDSGASGYHALRVHSLTAASWWLAAGYWYHAGRCGTCQGLIDSVTCYE